MKLVKLRFDAEVLCRGSLCDATKMPKELTYMNEKCNDLSFSC